MSMTFNKKQNKTNKQTKDRKSCLKGPKHPEKKGKCLNFDNTFHALKSVSNLRLFSQKLESTIINEYKSLYIICFYQV